VASGDHHTIVVTKNKVYSFGNNKFGQLATDNRLTYDAVVNVTKNINPKSIITCGDYNTTVLYQGNLYAYGWEEGTKANFDVSPLTKFPIDNVIDVYCRDSLTLLLVKEGNKKYIYNYEAYILKQGFLGSLYSRYSHKWEIPSNYHFTQL
jgi:alpha-tubulin suppressor-like RCC1 family protein